jgi:hypothetical protein
MTDDEKKLLMYAGIAIFGYWCWRRYKKKVESDRLYDQLQNTMVNQQNKQIGNLIQENNDLQNQLFNAQMNQPAPIMAPFIVGAGGPPLPPPPQPTSAGIVGEFLDYVESKEEDDNNNNSPLPIGQPRKLNI